jgi:hypothetical protein
VTGDLSTFQCQILLTTDSVIKYNIGPNNYKHKNKQEFLWQFYLQRNFRRGVLPTTSGSKK